MLRKNTIYDNLQYVDSGKNKEERFARLKEIDCTSIKQIFELTYNPNLKWMLPDKEYKFNFSRDEPNSTTLNFLKEIKKIAIFLNVGTYANLPEKKRENIFVSMLENIHPDDTKVLLAMRQRKLPFKNLTKSFVEEFYKGGFPRFWKKST